MIQWKLYSRMTDMAEEAALSKDWEMERALVDFQDEIGWPFRASPEQVKDWNERNWE